VGEPFPVPEIVLLAMVSVPVRLITHKGGGPLGLLVVFAGASAPVLHH